MMKTKIDIIKDECKFFLKICPILQVRSFLQRIRLGDSIEEIEQLFFDALVFYGLKIKESDEVSEELIKEIKFRFNLINSIPQIPKIKKKQLKKLFKSNRFDEHFKDLSQEHILTDLTDRLDDRGYEFVQIRRAIYNIAEKLLLPTRDKRLGDLLDKLYGC